MELTAVPGGLVRSCPRDAVSEGCRLYPSLVDCPLELRRLGAMSLVETAVEPAPEVGTGAAVALDKNIEPAARAAHEDLRIGDD
jgi:hypothetical protein